MPLWCRRGSLVALQRDEHGEVFYWKCVSDRGTSTRNARHRGELQASHYTDLVTSCPHAETLWTLCVSCKLSPGMCRVFLCMHLPLRCVRSGLTPFPGFRPLDLYSRLNPLRPPRLFLPLQRLAPLQFEPGLVCFSVSLACKERYWW